MKNYQKSWGWLQPPLEWSATLAIWWVAAPLRNSGGGTGHLQMLWGWSHHHRLHTVLGGRPATVNVDFFLFFVFCFFFFFPF
jgi:hypothetical protein